MGFHFHKNVDVFLVIAVNTGNRIGVETATSTALNNRSIIFISRQYAFAVHFEGVTDHGKERFFLPLSVNIPRSIEYFMATMLGVCLRKHHKLNVGWVSFKTNK